MLDFITMLAIMAMIFCVATVFVALIVGGLFKVGILKGHGTQDMS